MEVKKLEPTPMYGSYCDVRTKTVVLPGPTPEIEKKMARENRAYGEKVYKQIKFVR